MSTVSPRHKQRNGDATDWWLQQQSSGRPVSFQQSLLHALQDVIKSWYSSSADDEYQLSGWV